MKTLNKNTMRLYVTMAVFDCVSMQQDGLVCKDVRWYVLLAKPGIVNENHVLYFSTF